MGEAAGKITMKLLVDRNAKRVLFGEAGKDFVDFLFNFLSLPVGTVVKLLSKDKMVGSLGKIYESIEAMHANYLEPNVNKEHVLNPYVSCSSVANSPSLLGYKTSEPNDPKVLYRCNSNYNTNCRTYVSQDPEAECPTCKGSIGCRMTYVHGPGKQGATVAEGSGFVKGLVAYMVMDNLVVKPMSTISSITLLSTFKVKDMAALESVEVFIGKDEAVEILKASFVTDKVLTHLFLGDHKV